MSELGLWTLGLGVVLLIVHTTAVVMPAVFCRQLSGVSRNRPAGYVLALAVLLWSAWLVYNMPLGGMEHLRKYLFIVTPAVIAGVFFFMDELLAPRALGGLLLLYPAPVLVLARLHSSPWSLLMSVVCYIMVMKGILLVLNPWYFRQASEIITASDSRCRAFGIVGLLFALLLCGLALFVY